MYACTMPSSRGCAWVQNGQRYPKSLLPSPGSIMCFVRKWVPAALHTCQTLPVASGDHVTIADLGEFGLIAALAAGLPRGERTVVGIGDDAPVLTTPHPRVVATTH